MSTCRSYEDSDGNPVRVQGDQPLTKEGQAALRQLIDAARAHMEAADVEATDA